MQGVGERGRDSILTKNGKNVGIIQCKQINKNVSRPDVLKEILKFILYYIQDKSLISNVNNFTYFFAVSKGFAETATNFIADFNNKYNEEEVKEISEKLISTYSTLRNLNYTQISEEIKNTIHKIQVKPIIPSDISQYLYEHDKLIKNFFRVLTVTDNSLLEAIIENYLSPILKQVYNKKDRAYIDFTYRFKEYLQRVYNYYSSSRTLLFGNQQKRLEDFYYPLNLECSIDNESNKNLIINTLNYEEDFLPIYKKIIIVDNGGMGKSTIMKWLFLSVIKERKGIPIFIELRKLKNKKTVIDEIIQELNPVDESLERDVVTRLISQGNFIFFLDGYDEISNEDREFVTTDLQNFISKSMNNLFIMTSRPETALNTFSDFKEFRVKKLLKKEAFELIKKIGNNSDKSFRLIDKINTNDFQNINEFLQSPLLVSLLFKKFEHRENIPLHLQEFYYDVFEALFQDHDLTKGDSYIRDKATKLSFSEFFQVLRELGFYTLKKGEIEYNDAVIAKYLQEISKRLPHIKFNPHDFLEDLVKNVPLFNKEGLQYRWSHKSFQEYFASEFICRDTKDKQIEILRKMHNSIKSEKYFSVLSLCYDIDYNSFKEALIIEYLKNYIIFYENNLTELKNLEGDVSEQIDIRKALIFNRIYIIIFKNREKHLQNIFKLINPSNQNIKNQKIKSLPNIIEEGYHINEISVSKNFILITAVNRYDLFELLVKKNETFIKLVKIKRSNEIEDEKEVNSEFIIMNNSFNDSNNTPYNLFYYNKLILRKMSEKNSYILDYKKCKKYILDYENDLSNNQDDYYLSDF
ncbi:NACHT domain-containing protein [Chryseobacterium gleum]|nr:NACHT domain-containing protein [Chryseobacterium gleum]